MKNQSISSIVSITLIYVGVFGAIFSTLFHPKQILADNEPNITICHRTNSTTNPYVMITVDRNSVDGVSGNSNGNQADHYGEHTGPVWNSTMPNGGDWGDIIPPIPDFHTGLNWNAEGQALFENECSPLEASPSPTPSPTP